MRIALVSYEYPPQQGLGGVGTYMFRLAGALGRAGHEVHVITGPSDRPPVFQQHVHLHRIAACYEPMHLSKPMRWLFWKLVACPMSRADATIWHWLKWDLASAEAIRQLEADRPFDVLEAPEHAANGWMAGRLHHWPIVLRIHCPWELFVRINRLPLRPMHRLMAYLERRVPARYADAITLPSQAMLHEVQAHWRLRRPPRVVPNFMDVPPAPAPLPPDDGPQRIICTGRIEPLKGQDVLAKAFAMVAPRHPRAELWIVGPDRWPGKRRFAELLPRLVPDAEIRRRIHMPGLLPLHAVAETLRTARMAVAASVGFESFSYSTLEAMAAARPVIVAETGALTELIEHEKTGLVVGAGRAPQLAAAMERFLDDRPFSIACGLAAHAAARDRYDTRHVLPQVLSVYEEASEFFHRAASVADLPPLIDPVLAHAG